MKPVPVECRHPVKGNEVYILGHILSRPSMKHRQIKIDPSCLSDFLKRRHFDVTDRVLSVYCTY